MPAWTITTLDSTVSRRQGVDPDLRQAWKDAVDAALDELTTRAPDGVAIVMDGVPAHVSPGRTDDGRLDLPATRAAAERMAVAVMGGLD